MNPVHRMDLKTDNGADVLFVCPVDGCGRRLVLKRTGDLVVLNQGDFFSYHTGGTGGLDVSSGIVA